MPPTASRRSLFCWELERCSRYPYNISHDRPSPRRLSGLHRVGRRNTRPCASCTPRQSTRIFSDSPLFITRPGVWERSEEHTSELQSRLHLVCRLLLEKKKKT